MPDWKQSIIQWRALPDREKHRRRVLSIPQDVARSMAFEGEPVSVEMLEAELEQSFPKLFAAVPGATAARFALVDPPLPCIEETLRIGECFRQAVMSMAGKVLGEDKIPCVLSGHNLPEGNRHTHAFYLPEDTNNDGRIDCVTAYLPGGIDQECHRVLVRLMRLWSRTGQKWRVLLETISDTNALMSSSTLFGTSSSWTSITPYLHPWHLKKNFTVEDQLRRECRERGLPEIVHQTHLPGIHINGRALHASGFHRRRSKCDLVQPDTRGSFRRIEFAQPVRGPIALGFGCHFGLGMFRAVKNDVS